MRFNKLKLKNFGRHHRAEFEFDPRMNVIIGPNGSGKSTLMGALRYMCTGDTGLSGPLARSIMYGKDHSQVELGFEHGGEEGHLIRSLTGLNRTSSGAELYFRGVRHSGARPVNAAILEMLGCPLIYIQKYAFVGQNSIDSWFDKTPAERSAEFGKLLDLGKWEKAYQEAGRALTSIRLPDNREQEVQRLEQKIRSLEVDLSAARESLSEDQETLRQHKEQLPELEDRLKELQGLREDWAEYHRGQKFLLSRESARRALWAEFTRRPPTPTEERPEDSLLEEIDSLYQESKQAVRDSESEQKRRESLIARGTCPTCGTKMTEEHLSQAHEGGLSLEDEVELMRSLETELQRYTRILEKYDLRERAVSDLRRKVTIERSMAASVGLTDPPSTSEEALEEEDKRIQSKKYGIARMEAAVEAASGLLDRQARELGTMKAELSELEEKQKDYLAIKAGRSRLEGIRAILHRDAAPAYLLRSKLDTLFQSMPQALSAFEAPFSVMPMTDGLGFICRFSDERGEQVDTNISGGERVVLSWALRLAMDKAVSGGHLGFLGLDEPTAGLDAYNLSKMPTVLDRLRDVAEARNLQILFITHERSFADLFDKVIDLT